MRIVTVAITASISGVLSLYASSNFAVFFADFLLLVLYFFIPWTAINLTDYFIVRKGHYAITEIFKPNGIYGRWGWAGITAYLVAFACMTPFFDISGFYVGFASQSMGGVDVALFVGLPIGALLYWLFTRNLDVAAEQLLAEEQADALELASQEQEDLPGALVD
ncbi:cytosine permease [Cryobacterium breve]|uniref:cytosine permease n=1 Tax=Cryobacterium breve TaxID=1259258 RepID=UPI00248C7A25|nr:cytosine permease [Cryobacterium breve]